MSNARRVALVGFMGTGKTTVGSLLATALGLPFVDLDAMVEERVGLSLPAVFALHGEVWFRARERELLAEALARPRLVLATGGGIVLDPANVRVLRADGLVVALTASLSTILARVGRGAGRPLLAGKDPAGAAAGLLAERLPLYRQAADLVLDTDDLCPREATRRIAAWCETRWRGEALDD